MVIRKLVSLAVPVSIALAAFLHAHAIGSLIDATAAPSSIAPFAEARAAQAAASSSSSSSSSTSKSSTAILDRNPFDHLTGPLNKSDVAGSGGDDFASPDYYSDPFSAPACTGVRAVVAVEGANADASFAALDLGSGKRMLQRRGGDVGDMRVVYVASDRVWLAAKGGTLCQARVFGGAAAITTTTTTTTNGENKQPGTTATQQNPFEKEISKKVVKSGPNEFQIDRGAVGMILEAQTELMKTPLVPEKEGDRVVGFRLVKIRPGSVLATLGLESNDRLTALNGIEVTSTERMLEAYAKLRSGTIDRFTISVVRNGKPTNLDYVVK